jgi:hypothetical protein
MTKKLLSTILVIIGLATASLGQRKINFIIQVNERLVVGEISNIHFTFDSVNSNEKFPIDYSPGDLIISDELWSKVNSDSSRPFFLIFDYNTITKSNHKIANFFVELKSHNLLQRYSILNIYDFRNKKYKHWYQWHTDKDFLAELNYPNSGVKIRRS